MGLAEAVISTVCFLRGWKRTQERIHLNSMQMVSASHWHRVADITVLDITDNGFVSSKCFGLGAEVWISCLDRDWGSKVTEMKAVWNMTCCGSPIS